MLDQAPVTARRAATAFILVTVALDVLSLGIVIPVLPKLIESFVGGDTASASRAMAVFGTAWALMQFVFSPIQGSLSDRFGRRPVILLSNLGTGLDYILMALAPSLAILFVGRLISGITAASFSTASAYVADVTKPADRASAFGMIGAAFGLGFVLGPAIGGVLGEADPRLPFWVAAVFSLANAVYGWIVLPESLGAERRTAFSWRRANPLGALTLLRSKPQLTGIASVMFLFNLAQSSLPAVFVLYGSYRYGWSTGYVGATLALVGVCSAIVQGGLIKPISARIGARGALLAGLLCGVTGMAIYGLAPYGFVFWLGVPVMAFWGLASASAQSIMSGLVSPSEQGQLQGASSSVQALSSLFGPSLFSLVFSEAIDADRALKLPGAPFLLAAGLLLVATILAWRVTRRAGSVTTD